MGTRMILENRDPRGWDTLLLCSERHPGISLRARDLAKKWVSGSIAGSGRGTDLTQNSCFGNLLTRSQDTVQMGWAFWLESRRQDGLVCSAS